MRFKYLLFSSLIAVSLFVVLAAARLAPVQAAPQPAAPAYDVWQFDDTSPFSFTRFDAEYSPTTGKVYFLGGRLADGTTDGSVWEFDPMTGVYADTGVDMPVPVSNYQIALLTDGIGDEVMVIFGSRPAAGGVTNVVQGYKPVSNTTVDYTATDPYPISTSPGGVVVYDNIAYTLGGFDAVAVTANTYLFDITAVPGSRFTAGPPLNQARAYIGTAVVDGYIYAVGGDDYDGSSLIALTTAERLDPTNPVAWDDAGVADMPLACDEMPAFGFDSTSSYDLAGSVVTAGCGQWSSELPDSLLYDVATDTWDQTFPPLNDVRRNHAGVFIPVGPSINGLPGIWVWGGRQGSDTTILNTVEHYTVIELMDFTLSPRIQTIAANGTVTVTLQATNISGADETFDLTYTGSQTWPITGPASIFVADGETETFTFQVEIPPTAACFAEDVIDITGTGQGDPALTDTVQANVQQFCPTGIAGMVSDANTALGIPQAYVYMELTTDSAVYEEAFADANGDYGLTGILTGTYYLYGSAQGYELSILPQNWPAGADVVTITRGVMLDYDVVLNAPVLNMSAGGYSATVLMGSDLAQTLVISNSGSSDLNFSIADYDSGLMSTPRAPLPQNPFGTTIDPRILSDLRESVAGTADFIVIMKEQADLSAAYNMTDWNVRGQYVYDTLLQTATRTQMGLRAYLNAQGWTYRPFIASNGLLVRAGTLELVNTLAARPDVAYLMANASVQLETITPSLAEKLSASLISSAPTYTLTWGLTAVNADDVWTSGALGEGVVVANIDSGVEWTHPALVNQYRGGVDDHDYNWYMPTSGCAGQTEPCDNNGHGTHTMGTMVGSENPADPFGGAYQTVGVAPGAEWIACKGCETNGCSYEALLACGDWIVAPTDLTGANPDPSQRPHVVNNSWGGGGGDFWYGGVVAAWRAAGIFPQFSAGNSGPSCSTTGSPGDYWLSYNAAALTSSIVAAGFSSRGPADVTNLTKPSISAPGAAVYSSVPGHTYAYYSGTSMASPHVAGVVALLWSVKPELIGHIEETMWLLSQTATPLYTTDGCGGDTGTTYPNNTYGWGIVNAMEAVTTTVVIPASWVNVSPLGGTVAPGQSQTVVVTFMSPPMTGLYEGYLLVTADEPYHPQTELPLTMTVLHGLYLPTVIRP